MSNITKFVSEHLHDDINRLILDRKKWPEIDMELAVSCIESRRKLRTKVPQWYAEEGLIFPAKLSAEQCSSTATAIYKAKLAELIATEGSERQWRIADLTGGMGIDSWYFAQRASEVLYNEMQQCLCDAARHNFMILNTSNIIISNREICAGTSFPKLFDTFMPDIIYMDPARRSESGRKVFLMEQCSPDVLTLKEDIFSISRHFLLKLSPMADISMVCDRLGPQCREVHIVASDGECKELLIWMDREWNDEPYIIACELKSQEGEPSVCTLVFKPSEEKEASAKNTALTGAPEEKWLFEPGKSLMKAGAFGTIRERFRISKIGKSTHYYTFCEDEKVAELMKYGKVFRIVGNFPLDKQTIRHIGKSHPRAEVTARNLPMDSDALRKKLGVTASDDTHIFGLRSDIYGNRLYITEPLRQA